MNWFLNLFQKTLEMSNSLKQRSTAMTPSTVKIGEEDYQLVANQITSEQRCDLLNSIFTQELVRKVVFSVFQPDREMATNFIVLRIL